MNRALPMIRTALSGLGLAAALLLGTVQPSLAQTNPPDPEALQREAMQKLVEKQAREAELKAIEQRLAGNKDAREKLESEIAAIRADRAALNKALLETTARTQAGEQKLGDLEKRLSLLQSSEAAIRRSLDSRRGLIAEVLNAVAQSPDGSAPGVEAAVKEKVKALTSRFPIYQ